MTSFNYKERFIQMVREGSKPFVICPRRDRPARVGSTLTHLYKHQKKVHRLFTDRCADIRTIMITEDGNVMVFEERLKKIPKGLVRICLHRHKLLSERERDQLAWLDGFRPEGSSLSKPAGCFDIMMRWRKQTHDLPFTGDIIVRDISNLLPIVKRLFTNKINPDAKV